MALRQPFPLLYPDGGIPGLLYQRIRPVYFTIIIMQPRGWTWVLKTLLTEHRNGKYISDTNRLNFSLFKLARYAGCWYGLLNPGVKNRWKLFWSVGTDTGLIVGGSFCSALSSILIPAMAFHKVAIAVSDAPEIGFRGKHWNLQHFIRQVPQSR